jgi:hypothetical protein
MRSEAVDDAVGCNGGVGGEQWNFLFFYGNGSNETYSGLGGVVVLGEGGAGARGRRRTGGEGAWGRAGRPGAPWAGWMVVRLAMVAGEA